jgi:hypothetical protein
MDAARYVSRKARADGLSSPVLPLLKPLVVVRWMPSPEVGYSRGYKSKYCGGGASGSNQTLGTRQVLGPEWIPKSRLFFCGPERLRGHVSIVRLCYY